MYGIEAQSSGGGGLAAQAPADLYFAGAIPSGGPLIGSPKEGGVMLANTSGEPSAPEGLMYGSKMASSGVAAVPVASQTSNWSSVLDFHNSVAPWILLAILLLYGWIHVSVRAKAGRAHAGGFIS